MDTKQLAVMFFPLISLIIIPLVLIYNFQGGNFIFSFYDPFIFIGILLAITGSVILATSVMTLHQAGEGAIAPWDASAKLVTSGLYAYTRNPMISGAILVLLGEAAIFGSLSILVWAFTFFILNSLYFNYYEEPSLEKKFGEEYKEYKKNVSAWKPRRKPWKK